ncbi:dual specificity protein phosphatase family protein [Pleomorphomonas carboxyditropha]|nr:dual specificity protein phosphatase family protein [Pleomorphomonas carboxyditropha]
MKRQLHKGAGGISRLSFRKLGRWTGMGLLIAGMALLLIGLPIGGFAVYVYHDRNFHRVLAGELYRSGQMSDKDLAIHIRTHGIRSVLNLRGAQPKQSWYVSEVGVSQALGVRHYDLALSADLDLKPSQRDELLRIMSEAPRPLLIHCKQGADRTGLAAALYLRHGKQRSLKEAGKQLSIWYGHFPWLGSGTGAMDRSLAAAEYPDGPTPDVANP